MGGVCSSPNATQVVSFDIASEIRTAASLRHCESRSSSSFSCLVVQKSIDGSVGVMPEADGATNGGTNDAQSNGTKKPPATVKAPSTVNKSSVATAAASGSGIVTT